MIGTDTEESAVLDPAVLLPPRVFCDILFFVDEVTLFRSVPFVSKAWHEASNDEGLWRSKYLGTWRKCRMPSNVRDALAKSNEFSQAEIPQGLVELVREYRNDARTCHCGMCNEDDSLIPPILSCSWKGSFVVRWNIERDLFGDVYRRTPLCKNPRLTLKHLRRAANSVTHVGTALSESPAARKKKDSNDLSQEAIRRHNLALSVYGAGEKVVPEDILFGVADELIKTACGLPEADEVRLSWDHWVKVRVDRALALSMSAPDAVRNKELALQHFKEAEDLCATVTAKFRSVDVLLMWASVLYHHASIFLDDDHSYAEKLLLHSWEIYNSLLETLSDPDSGFFNGMGDTAEMLSQTQVTAGAIDQWFGLAVLKYETACTIDNSNGAVINNLALSIHNHAFMKTGEASKELLRQAVTLYEQALDNDDEKYVVYYNEGDALTQLAHLTVHEETAMLYFKLAIKNYEKSCSINSNYYSSFNNWGWAWLENANRSPSDEAAELNLEKALTCFIRALQLRPRYHISISNCGNVALERACRKNRDEDWNEALAKYRQALSVKPKFAKGLHYIGLLHMERGRRLPDTPENRVKRAEWYKLCIKQCQEALSIKPGYPLCLFTLTQAQMLLDDRASASKTIETYNILTGSSVSDRKTVPLTLELFEKYNTDLTFNFKSFPWKFCQPERRDLLATDVHFLRSIYSAQHRQEQH